MRRVRRLAAPAKARCFERGVVEVSADLVLGEPESGEVALGLQVRDCSLIEAEAFGDSTWIRGRPLHHEW